MSETNTLNDLMTLLSTDDILSDTEYAAGSMTWSDTARDEFGTSCGGLFSAGSKAGYFTTNGEAITLTEAGAEEIARIRG